MKRLLLVLFFLAAPALAVKTVTEANLPASCTPGRTYKVTDADAVDDCDPGGGGGGATVAMCMCNSAGNEYVELLSTNSATATALAANGANCSVASAAGGVDASGAAEACVAPLLLTGGVLTGELTADDLGIEFTEGDTLTDCSTFSATGGGIFYDDSEGTFKKCEDNVLTDLDAAGSGLSNIVEDVTPQIGGELDMNGQVISSAVDESHLVVQGHTTQTNPIFTIEQSDGTDVFTVANDGTTTIGAAGTATLDANGANAITIGSADVTVFTVTTDGTGDGEAVLPLDSIGLGEMSGGTDGNLITYDASGDPAAVATGTANQVLTSNGAGAAPTFQAAAGGGATAVKQAYPMGGKSGNHTGVAADACYCHEWQIPNDIDSMDTVVYSFNTQSDTDTMEMGIYSQDGATQYFEATLDVDTGGCTVGSGTFCEAVNELTVVDLPAGVYLFCHSTDDDSASIQEGNISSNGQVFANWDNPSCASGEMPATISKAGFAWTQIDVAMWGLHDFADADCTAANAPHDCCTGSGTGTCD